MHNISQQMKHYHHYDDYDFESIKALELAFSIHDYSSFLKEQVDSKIAEPFENKW